MVAQGTTEAFELWEEHQERLEKLTSTLERLHKSIRKTEIALAAEEQIGEQLEAQRRRFGLLAHLIDT